MVFYVSQISAITGRYKPLSEESIADISYGSFHFLGTVSEFRDVLDVLLAGILNESLFGKVDKSRIVNLLHPRDLHQVTEIDVGFSGHEIAFVADSLFSDGFGGEYHLLVIGCGSTWVSKFVLIEELV